jgi:hypothetical protein
MTTLVSPSKLFSGLLCILLLCAVGDVRAAFKCQDADGKIEYSDRRCDPSKTFLDRTKANKSVQSKPIAVPMDQLQSLFTDFEQRLCEREVLGAELDRASRAGEITKAPTIWRAKQDKIIELNDVMVDFQQRAVRITKPTGSESPETAALRRFQESLKTCQQRSIIQPPAPHPSSAPALALAKPASK